MLLLVFGLLFGLLEKILIMFSFFGLISVYGLFYGFLGRCLMKLFLG